MTAFADTFALIAWLNPRDESHTRVCSYLEGFTGRLITTEWVLVELADALSAPAARATVVEFLKSIRSDSAFEVVGYDPSVYEAGFRLFASRADKSGHGPIAISFSVMSDRGLIDALTADHDFEQAGFRAVFK